VIESPKSTTRAGEGANILLFDFARRSGWAIVIGGAAAGGPGPCAACVLVVRPVGGAPSGREFSGTFRLNRPPVV
jgi:hypothetical protein